MHLHLKRILCSIPSWYQPPPSVSTRETEREVGSQRRWQRREWMRKEQRIKEIHFWLNRGDYNLRHENDSVGRCRIAGFHVNSAPSSPLRRGRLASAAAAAAQVCVCFSHTNTQTCSSELRRRELPKGFTCGTVVTHESTWCHMGGKN